MAHPADNGQILSTVDDIREFEFARGMESQREDDAALIADLQQKVVGLEDAVATRDSEIRRLEKQWADHMEAEHPTEPPPDPDPVEFGRRFYVTQQFSTLAELRNYEAQFIDAESTVPAANGLSGRFPWKAYEADKSIARVAVEMMPGSLPHRALRSMAGKHTPAAKMGRTLTEDGTTYPSPFGDTAGNPNTAFLDHLEAHYRELAAILEATDEVDPILQWTWYAKEWAEIYHGPAVRSAPGYSVDNFIRAHNALIDRAAAVQRDFPGVVMGLQLSGHGPIGEISGGRILVAELVKHAAEAFEPGRAIIHANGWSYRGQWGQSNPDVDAAMDAAFDAAHAGGLHVGMQAIQPWGVSGTYPQYTATQVGQAFAQADAVGTTSIELYTPSFLSRNGGAVWANPTATWINEEN